MKMLGLPPDLSDRLKKLKHLVSGDHHEQVDDSIENVQILVGSDLARERIVKLQIASQLFEQIQK